MNVFASVTSGVPTSYFAFRDCARQGMKERRIRLPEEASVRRSLRRVERARQRRGLRGKRIGAFGAGWEIVSRIGPRSPLLFPAAALSAALFPSLSRWSLHVQAPTAMSDCSRSPCRLYGPSICFTAGANQGQCQQFIPEPIPREASYQLSPASVPERLSPVLVASKSSRGTARSLPCFWGPVGVTLVRV